MREPPIVALLTDFGLQDYYVGAMKGAVLRCCPDATLVDITHEVPAHDVATGALLLDSAHDSFPPRTLFLAVVDPGVGSARRALALRAGGFLFVGPDNGLFTFVLDRYLDARVQELADPRLRRAEVSPVFHGRDLFGPAAGLLAGGFPLEEAGPLVADPLRLTLPAKVCSGDACQGAVVLADRFGNLITNLQAGDLRALAAASLEIRVAELRLSLVDSYAAVPVGEPCALVGSSGRLEIAVRQGRADRQLGLAPGATVRVTKAG